MADKHTVRARYSKMTEEIAKLLKSEGFILSIERDGYFLDIVLNEAAPLVHIKRLSRPSLRRYVGYSDIPRPRTGYSTVILSTPKGLLTGNQARKQKVGGELVCEVW
jgi:small subunit ribosomal protein S8